MTTRDASQTVLARQEVMHALLREPNRHMADGITKPELIRAFGRPTHKEALESFYAFAEVLDSAGIRVSVLHADKKGNPDAHFLKDLAVVAKVNGDPNNQVAILLMPATPQRQKEQQDGIDEITAALQSIPVIKKVIRLDQMPTTQDGATIEGGDIVQSGNDILVGNSTRTNTRGAFALAEILIRLNHDSVVHFVPVSDVLHADSALTSYLVGRILHDESLHLSMDIPYGNRHMDERKHSRLHRYEKGQPGEITLASIELMLQGPHATTTGSSNGFPLQVVHFPSDSIFPVWTIAANDTLLVPKGFEERIEKAAKMPEYSQGMEILMHDISTFQRLAEVNLNPFHAMQGGGPCLSILTYGSVKEIAPDGALTRRA